MKNKVFSSLISSVLFGLFYSFIIEENMNWGSALKIAAIYFIVSCLFHYIAPKLKKIIGRSKRK